jgi:flavin reductase (DIM6/NTAB) family NADH-FMN oxidoreductase RutF
LSDLELVDAAGHGDLRRRITWTVPTALAVLGTVNDDRSGHLMNISWVVPAANDPPSLVASIETASRTATNLEREGAFALSLLSRDQRHLGRAFVKPDLDHRDGSPPRVGGEPIGLTRRGAPYLLDALAVLAGSAAIVTRLGSHDLWVCQVEDVAAQPVVTEGPASAHASPALSVLDTRLNYGR